MGNTLILAATGKSSSPNLLPILIIVVLFVLLYMTMIRPQRNRQRQAQQMQSTVEPGSPDPHHGRDLRHGDVGGGR